MQKIVFICLAAYRIESWSDAQNFNRQSVYAIAMENLFKISPEETKFIITDNTVSDKNDVIKELADQFENPRVINTVFINNNALGAKNKGAGEYQMCQAVVEKHKAELESADWVVYYTSRQIMSFPKIFESINSNPDADIIISNPSYLFSNGKENIAAEGNYNDMLFAMKPQSFFGYVASMNPEELVKKKMNSEQNLFDYVGASSDKKIVDIPRLGVFRFNYATNKMEII